MKKLFIALQFLTILPIRIRSGIEEKDLGGALLYFPAVGMVIGSILAGVSCFFNFLPAPVAGALVLITCVVITGGIHLDGFADVCDGFYGHHPKEKILQIMRDSRVGAMGAMGITSLLLLKFVLIVSLPQNILWRILILMVVFARWVQVLVCCTSDYPRKEGKAQHFMAHAGKRELIGASVFTAGLFFFLMGLNGIILFVLSFLPVFLFVSYVKRRLGGMTGDTIGASSEIAEVVVLFCVVVHFWGV